MSSSRSEVETDDKSLHSEICLFCRKIRQKKPGGDEDMDGKKNYCAHSNNAPCPLSTHPSYFDISYKPSNNDPSCIWICSLS